MVATPSRFVEFAEMVALGRESSANRRLGTGPLCLLAVAEEVGLVLVVGAVLLEFGAEGGEVGKVVEG